MAIEGALSVMMAGAATVLVVGAITACVGSVMESACVFDCKSSRARLCAPTMVAMVLPVTNEVRTIKRRAGVMSHPFRFPLINISLG